MSDLEFQRELSAEQMREALSLLDRTAGAQNQNLRIEDLRPAEEVNPEPDHSSTTMTAQDRPPAAEDPLQRKKHLNLVVGYFGIAIAARPALWCSCHGAKACFHRQGSLSSSPRKSRQHRRRTALLLRCRLPSLHLTRAQVHQSDSPRRRNSQV